MGNGVSFMNKPNFSEMTRKELRAYALAHRDDDDVITELIRSANPNCPIYPYPKTEADIQQMSEIFRRKIAGDDPV
jgi:hypothetical protein